MAGNRSGPVTCDALTAVTSDSTTITSAAWAISPATIGGINVNTRFCRVQGSARPSTDSDIRFEVWLPATADAWTGRFKLNGTGGYAGATPYARLAQDVADGMVSAGSNQGGADAHRRSAEPRPPRLQGAWRQSDVLTPKQ